MIRRWVRLFLEILDRTARKRAEANDQVINCWQAGADPMQPVASDRETVP